MRDDEIITIGILITLFIGLVIITAALIAGNIVNELLEPLPELAGPIGAAVALLVFLFLGGKGISVLAGILEG